MIEDEKELQTGTNMDSSDVTMNDDGDQISRDFLLSLFECENKTDEKMLRFADAIIDVQGLNFDVSPQSLQSNIAEIITKFVLLSQDGPKRETEQLYNFIDPNAVSGCREENAIEFLLATGVRCCQALSKNDGPESSQLVYEATKKAGLSVFIMIQRGYLENTLRQQQANLVFVKRLLDDTISTNFLRNLVEYAGNPEESDPEALEEAFGPIFDILRSGMIIQHYEDNDKATVHHILRVMTVLLTTKNGIGRRHLCHLLVNRPDFIPSRVEKLPGREFGLMSYLGPFFDYGLVSSSRRPNNRVFVDFEKEARNNDGSVNTEQTAYFNIMTGIRSSVHQMILPLLLEEACRVKTLKWISEVIATNNSRNRTHFEPSTVLSDHFMVNILSLMYRLSEKIDMSKINRNYPFQPGALVNISKETRLKMDESAATNFAIKFADTPADSHFSTVCFFLTISAQQLVIPPLMTQISDYSRHIKDLNSKIKNLREKLTSAVGFERGEIEKKIAYETEHWKMMSRHLLCLKSQIQDPSLIASAMDFADKQVKLVLNSLCDNLNLMGDDNQLPENPTDLFCAYPEHYLEDVFDFYVFALSNGMKLLMERNSDWVDRLTVLFTHYHYIKSPFLVSKLVRVLTSIQVPLWYNVVNLRMAQDKLLLCMIRFYSDFEDNGDFYEKFNVRGNIQYMLEKMRENVFYKSKFMDMAKECGSEFIRFVNMIINDATWCIDESLSGLKSIHDIEKKMTNKIEWDSLDQDARNQDLGVYEESKRKVKGWLGTAKSNLKMILSITDNSQEPFCTPALGERLAAMLNHNLSQLIGNKCVELKVRNPASYGWDPREFVTLLILIYQGLNVPAFVKYIAYDERTYSPEFFNRVIQRLTQTLNLSSSQVERFQHLAEEVQKEYEAKAELEEEYDDVPEEFKDPIMDAIMVDPVKLPSGHVMDRAVIERHLLSTPNNPFNRAPLSHGDLVPDHELKAKIQEWIAQKRSSKK